MKLKSIKIHNYKCFYNAPEFDINDVTCLVGINESGKSALLEAIYKFKPLYENEKKYLKEEAFVNSDLDVDDNNSKNVISIDWELDSNELNKIESYFGFMPLKSNIFGNVKEFENNSVLYYPSYFISELEAVEEIKNKYNLETNVETIVDCLKIIDNEKDLPEIKRLIEVFSKNEYDSCIIQFLKTNFVTQFVLFNKNIFIPSKIYFNELTNSYSETFVLVRQILEYCGKDVTKIMSMNPTDSNSYLINLENVISKKINNNRWLNSEELKFVFRIHTDENNTKFITIEISIHGLKKTIKIDKKSIGFQWFISFILWITVNYTDKPNNIILLLDEPSLHLHGSAQSEFVNFLYNELLGNNITQIIYTTHSPFMINKSRLSDIKVIEKSKDGTSFITDVLHMKNNISILPLHSALGFDIKNSFLIKLNNLIVEGISDEIYLNYFIEKYLSSGIISNNWNIISTEGCSNQLFMFKVLINNKLNPVIISDYDKNNSKLEDDFRNNEYDLKKIIKLNRIISNDKRVDIEDLLGSENYLHLLNQTYKKDIQMKNEYSKKTAYEIECIFISETNEKVRHGQVAKYFISNGGLDQFAFKNKQVIETNFQNLLKIIDKEHKVE